MLNSSSPSKRHRQLCREMISLLPSSSSSFANKWMGFSMGHKTRCSSQIQQSGESQVQPWFSLSQKPGTMIVQFLVRQIILCLSYSIWCFFTCTCTCSCWHLSFSRASFIARHCSGTISNLEFLFQLLGDSRANSSTLTARIDPIVNRLLGQTKHATASMPVNRVTKQDSVRIDQVSMRGTCKVRHKRHIILAASGTLCEIERKQ